MIKLLIGILVLALCSSQEAHACEWAVQSRILPLGMVNQEIIAVNLRMKRDHDGPNTTKTDYWWWHGQAALIAINPRNFHITKTYQSENYSWHHTDFQPKLDELYNRYLKVARNLPNLHVFKPESIEVYNFFKREAPVKFVLEPGDTSAHLVFADDNIKTPLPLWDCTDSNTILYYQTAKTFAEYEEIDEFKVPRWYKIGSIRSFTLGEYKLLMVHIGFGEQYNLDGEEILFEGNVPAFDKLENCSYDESVMWHGIGLDIPLLMN